MGRGQTVFAARAEQPSALLSEREREVLSLMASGKTNKEIADLLFLSPHTVKEHTSALYRKLRVRNRDRGGPARRAARAWRLSLDARARVHALDPGGEVRPALDRQVLHEHVMEGLVVGGLG